MAVALGHESDGDQRVIEAARRGDPAAFAALAARNGDWVRGVIFGVLGNHDELDDVAQQVWTTVWHQLDRLRDVRCWRSWLYRLARNAALDAGRDQARRREVCGNGIAMPETAYADAGPAARVVAGEQAGVVMQAIRDLPPLYREPFVLRHVQGWSYAQIAEVMGLPVDTVETRLVRARRRLRACLKGRV